MSTPAAPGALPFDGRRPRAPRRRMALVGLVAMVAAVVMPAATAGALPTVRFTESASDHRPTPPEGTVVQGVLERLVIESRHNRDRTGSSDDADDVPLTWLRAPEGRIPLLPDAVRTVPTGSTIAVRVGGPAGAASGTGDAHPREVTSLTVLTRATSTPSRTATAAVHRVTVVLALPSGSRADATTAAGLSRVVAGEVSRFWSHTSDGRISFSVSKTVGWTRLTASCRDPWAVWDEVRRRTGFVPGVRRHLLVYTPPSSGCPTGLATVGASAQAGGYVLVGGSTTALIAHELGHNLGLGHSDALVCTTATDATFTGSRSGATFGQGCRRVPYGDWYDVMGISWENLGSLSTAHAFRLGLLGSGAVATVRGPARVRLRPVSGRTGLRSLRIQDPAGAGYVVEYRPAAGIDAWLGTRANWRGLRPGVLLRRVDPLDQTQTLLLDPTPSAGSATDQELALPAGRMVATASGRVTLVVESVSPDAAVVSVAMDGAWPALVIEPRGRLIGGKQVTIGQALATWGAFAS